jgi:hypothetical protein
MWCDEIVVFLVRAQGPRPGNYQDLPPNDPRIRIADDGTLHLHNIQKSSEGYYLCEATNDIGAGLSAVTYINVQGFFFFFLRTVIYLVFLSLYFICIKIFVSSVFLGMIFFFLTDSSTSVRDQVPEPDGTSWGISCARM